MLRSMSKQRFTARLFTYLTSDTPNKSRARGPEAIPQLFCFDHVATTPLKGVGLDRFPVRSPRLFFSVGTGSNLKICEPPRAGVSSAPPHIAKSICTQLDLKISCPTSTPTQNTRRSTMKESNRSIYFRSPTHSAIDFEGKGDSGNASRLTRPHRLSFSTGSGAKPRNISFLTVRCSEKGCVFPASSSGHGKCIYHKHQQEEPVLFRSHQPTGMLLDPARTMPTEKQYDGSRKRDRRRMAAIWERFQNDGTS
jgi:hypothetical protein